MSQADIGDLVPSTTSGTALSNLLQGWRDALHSQHSGSARPSYVAEGMIWLDTTSNPYKWKHFDGANDIIVGYMNPTNSLFYLNDETRIVDQGDTTKRFRFDLSTVTAGQTRTYKAADRDGTIQVMGGVRTITAAGSITIADIGKDIVFNSASDITVTIDAAATLGDGFNFRYKNINTGVVTLDPNGSETIDGETTKPVRPHAYGNVVCNGSLFYVFNRKDGIIAPISVAGVSAYDFAIPSWVTEIAFDIDALQHSSGSTQSLGFQLGDGTIATSGYTGVAGAGGVSTGMWLTASGIGNTAAAMISGSIRCISADRKTWQENSIVGYTNNNSQNQSNARKTLTNALTTLRLTNSGAANFTAGTLSLKLY